VDGRGERYVVGLRELLGAIGLGQGPGAATAAPFGAPYPPPRQPLPAQLGNVAPLVSYTAAPKPMEPSARRFTSEGTLLRWGLAFGVPLAIPVAILGGIAEDAKFSYSWRGELLSPQAVHTIVAISLALAVVFMTGVFAARRTADMGRSLRVTIVAALCSGTGAALGNAWADTVHYPQVGQREPVVPSGVYFAIDAVFYIVLWNIVALVSGISVGAVGAAIGKRAMKARR